ncbi:MAG: DUF4097 family beta strand repeat-containing protein [Lachnospiraceae bacterium]
MENINENANTDTNANTNTNANTDAKKSGFNPTIFLIVMVIITAVCIVGGCLLRYRMRGWFGASNKVVQVEESLNEFQAIHLDADALEINIEYGDTYAYEYEGIEKLQPKVDVSNGELTISQSIHHWGFDWDFSSPNCCLTVTIPSDCIPYLDGNINAGNMEFGNLAFKEINLNMDAGNFEVNHLTASGLTLDVDAGNIIIRNADIEGALFVDAAAGNIELYECSIGGNSNLSANMGNIELHNCTIAGTNDVLADLGNVEFFNCEIQSKSNITANLGNVVLSNTNFDSAQMKVDMGNLEISGDFNEVSAVCALGEVNLETETLDGKSIHLETDLGEITVNGKDEGNSFNQ